MTKMPGENEMSDLELFSLTIPEAGGVGNLVLSLEGTRTAVVGTRVAEGFEEVAAVAAPATSGVGGLGETININFHARRETIMVVPKKMKRAMASSSVREEYGAVLFAG